MNSFEQFHQLTTNDRLGTNQTLSAEAHTLPISTGKWALTQPLEPNELTFDDAIWSKSSIHSDVKQNSEEQPTDPREELSKRMDEQSKFLNEFFERNPNLKIEWWKQRDERAQSRYDNCLAEREKKIPDGFEQNKWTNRPDGPYGNECARDNYGLNDNRHSYQIYRRDQYYRSDPDYGRQFPQFPPMGGRPGMQPEFPGRTLESTPSTNLDPNWKPESSKPSKDNPNPASGW